MTEQLERIVRLETRMDMHERRMLALELEINTKLEGVNAKLDTLHDVLTMGKGGWKAIAWLGSGIVAVITAAVWVWEHFIK